MAQMTLSDLMERADAYAKTCEIALSSKDSHLIQNALENAHLAVELALKAAIVKNGGKYRDFGAEGHDLSKLVVEKFKDGKRSIATEAKSIGADKLNIGLSAWSMDCRYKVRRDYADMSASIEDYKELYRWIKTNFL
jgi:HEPN domain-containing protein